MNTMLIIGAVVVILIIIAVVGMMMTKKDKEPETTGAPSVGTGTTSTPVVTPPTPVVTSPTPVNCVVSNYGNFGACQDVNGVWKKVRTRTIITQPANGGTPCPTELSETEICQPVACVQTPFGPYTSCDSTMKRQRVRTTVSQPQNGGAACGPLVEVDTQGCMSEFNKSICNYVSSKIGPGKVRTEPDTNLWINKGCEQLYTTPGQFPKDTVCTLVKNYPNDVDYKRAGILLECPGFIIKQEGFIGAGSTSGSYFDITLNRFFAISGKELRLNENIGKKIRIWYDSNNNPIGWGVPETWVYPVQFDNAGIKADRLGQINFTSALELMDKEVGTGKRFKLLLWFVGSNPGGIPANDPRGAVRWIVNNRPSSVTLYYGADANTFLSSDGVEGSISFGSGSLSSM